MLPLIQFGPNWAIPSYFLVISVTYCICLFYVDLRARAFERSREIALDLSFALMTGGFIGARLFHVFYEEPQWYIDHPVEVIKFWHGGFVFYGGFIGALLGSLIVLKLRHSLRDFWSWGDFFAPICALGYSLGRIGCLLDGCCFGRQCDLPWAIGGRHPTQLYATFWEFAVFLILIIFERRTLNAKNSAGRVFSLWLCLHGLGRIVMEHFRDDDRGPLLFGTSVSTAISIALIAIGALCWLRKSSRPKRGA